MKKIFKLIVFVFSAILVCITASCQGSHDIKPSLDNYIGVEYDSTNWYQYKYEHAKQYLLDNYSGKKRILLNGYDAFMSVFEGIISGPNLKYYTDENHYEGTYLFQDDYRMSEIDYFATDLEIENHTFGFDVYYNDWDSDFTQTPVISDFKYEMHLADEEFTKNMISLSDGKNREFIVLIYLWNDDCGVSIMNNLEYKNYKGLEAVAQSLLDNMEIVG